MAAKKKEASVIGGREEVIDRGLFGEGAAAARDPEDTITRVAKSNPYTGKSCWFHLQAVSFRFSVFLPFACNVEKLGHHGMGERAWGQSYVTVWLLQYHYNVCR